MAIIRNITMANKDHLNLIITGHIDNGKSTTMGHFLMDLGVVDERTIQSHAEESEKIGKGDTFKYAWVMDNIKTRENVVSQSIWHFKSDTAKDDIHIVMMHTLGTQSQDLHGMRL